MEMLPRAEGIERARSVADARWWFGLGVLALLIAGLQAVVLVIGRLPGIAPALITDVDFARRALVVHVNLSLGVWFFSMLAGLFCLLPGARPQRASQPAALLAIVGVLAFSSTMFMPSATPVLSNYIPALDHNLFLVGLGLFGVAVAWNFLDPRLMPTRGGLMPPDAQAGVRAGAVAYLLALATIGASWATQYDDMAPLAYFERLFWGGGHVLQFANVLGMTACWLFLLTRVLGRQVLHGRAGALLFAALAAPTVAGPWLAVREDGAPMFTTLMQFGIFPVVVLLILLCLFAMRRGMPPGARRTPAFAGFATGAAMTVLGFLLGASIGEVSTTLIPAHYHTSIGAVTATYMATIIVLLPELGLRPASRALGFWQPVVFGIGQTIFAFGLAIAGTWGQAERKVYGEEAAARTTGEWAGLVVMGAGGAVALTGGVLFLVILIKAWRGRPRAA